MTHLYVTMLGVILGILAVAWVRPDNSSGVVILVLIIVMAANIAGAAVRRIRGR